MRNDRRTSFEGVASSDLPVALGEHLGNDAGTTPTGPPQLNDASPKNRQGREPSTQRLVDHESQFAGREERRTIDERPRRCSQAKARHALGIRRRKRRAVSDIDAPELNPAVCRDGDAYRARAAVGTISSLAGTKAVQDRGGLAIDGRTAAGREAGRCATRFERIGDSGDTEDASMRDNEFAPLNEPRDLAVGETGAAQLRSRDDADALCGQLAGDSRGVHEEQHRRGV